MFGCYRKGEAHNPEVYVAGITATLADFPQVVVDYVTDPRTGLPGSLKWLPSIAEVREACANRLAAIRYAEWRNRKRERDAELAAMEKPIDPQQRQRVGELMRELVEHLRRFDPKD